MMSITVTIKLKDYITFKFSYFLIENIFDEQNL